MQSGLSLMMKSSSVTIQMKAIEHTFLWHCLLYMLCEVVLNFESVDEILKYDHSNESF